MRGALNFALVLFFAACIFDPADRLLGLKVPLFIACWLIALASCALSREKCYVHIDLVRYTLLFLLVPVLSVASYWAVDGGEPFEGFQLLKGYLLVTLGALLFTQRIDALPHLAALLTALALAIIGVFVTLLVAPGLAVPLRLFGNATGMLYLDSRDYGSGLVLSQVYFATSPMLAISVAYYYHLARVSSVTKRKLAYYAAAVVSIVAMPLAGTRNNIAVAIFLPLTLSVVYGKNRVASGIAALAFALGLVIVFFDEIAVLLNPLEFSNNLKLALLDDYANLLSQPSVLLFGKGLGSYDYWTPRGSEYFVTELTYLELFRTFGVLGALLVLALLLFPLLYAFFVRPAFTQGHIVIAYAFYLVMAVSNPTLFSSLGILILAIVLANIFLFEDRVRNGAQFPVLHPLVVARP
jgi:hypothetical protein